MMGWLTEEERAPMPRHAALSRPVVLIAALPLALAACTVAGAPTATAPASVSSTPGPSDAGQTPAAEASTLGVPQQVIDQVATLCAPGPGKTVTEFEDVPIPAIDEPGVSAPAAQAGSTRAEPIEVAPVHIPATAAEAGCVVRYDAPAGCLPQVEFSPAWIPAVEVPGYRITRLDGSVAEEPPGRAEARIVEGESVAQKCQIVTEEAKTAVLRKGMVRAGTVRAGFVRGAMVRSAASEDGERIDAVTIPSLTVHSVALPSQAVPAEVLPYERLTDGVDASSSDTVASYQAAESVLFEYNRSELLPTASAALDAILADAASHGFDGHVKVEGHTDDTGTDKGNQALSEARARAVADYLEAQGIAADRITAVGRGETAPAHPNDSDENRAKNRRVVIEFTQR